MTNNHGNGVIVLHKKDNVATTIFDLASGSKLNIGPNPPLIIQNPIPAGHKLALLDLPQHSKILKYGEVIGISTKPIAAGEHVHIHNVQSLRGRQDK